MRKRIGLLLKGLGEMKGKLSRMGPSEFGLSTECHQPLHKLDHGISGGMTYFSGCSQERDLLALSRLWREKVNMETVPMGVGKEGEDSELGSKAGFTSHCFPLTCNYLILKQYLP